MRAIISQIFTNKVEKNSDIQCQRRRKEIMSFWIKKKFFDYKSLGFLRKSHNLYKNVILKELKWIVRHVLLVLDYFVVKQIACIGISLRHTKQFIVKRTQRAYKWLKWSNYFSYSITFVNFSIISRIFLLRVLDSSRVWLMNSRLRARNWWRCPTCFHIREVGKSSTKHLLSLWRARTWWQSCWTSYRWLSLW